MKYKNIKEILLKQLNQSEQNTCGKDIKTEAIRAVIEDLLNSTFPECEGINLISRNNFAGDEITMQNVDGQTYSMKFSEIDCQNNPGEYELSMSNKKEPFYIKYRIEYQNGKFSDRVTDLVYTNDDDIVVYKSANINNGDRYEKCKAHLCIYTNTAKCEWLKVSNEGIPVELDPDYEVDMYIVSNIVSNCLIASDKSLPYERTGYERTGCLPEWFIDYGMIKTKAAMTRKACNFLLEKYYQAYKTLNKDLSPKQKVKKCF